MQACETEEEEIKKQQRMKISSDIGSDRALC